MWIIRLFVLLFAHFMVSTCEKPVSKLDSIGHSPKFVINFEIVPSRMAQKLGGVTEEPKEHPPEINRFEGPLKLRMIQPGREPYIGKTLEKPLKRNMVQKNRKTLRTFESKDRLSKGHRSRGGSNSKYLKEMNDKSFVKKSWPLENPISPIVGNLEELSRESLIEPLEEAVDSTVQPSESLEESLGENLVEPLGESTRDSVRSSEELKEGKNPEESLEERLTERLEERLTEPLEERLTEPLEESVTEPSITPVGDLKENPLIGPEESLEGIVEEPKESLNQETSVDIPEESIIQSREKIADESFDESMDLPEYSSGKLIKNGREISEDHLLNEPLLETLKELRDSLGNPGEIVEGIEDEKTVELLKKLTVEPLGGKEKKSQSKGGSLGKPGDSEPSGNYLELPGNYLEPPGNFLEPPGNYLEPPGNSLEPPENPLRRPKDFSGVPKEFLREPGGFLEGPRNSSELEEPLVVLKKPVERPIVEAVEKPVDEVLKNLLIPRQNDEDFQIKVLSNNTAPKRSKNLQNTTEEPKILINFSLEGQPKSIVQTIENIIEKIKESPKNFDPIPLKVDQKYVKNQNSNRKSLMEGLKKVLDNFHHLSDKKNLKKDEDNAGLIDYLKDVIINMDELKNTEKYTMKDISDRIGELKKTLTDHINWVENQNLRSIYENKHGLKLVKGPDDPKDLPKYLKEHPPVIKLIREPFIPLDTVTTLPKVSEVKKKTGKIQNFGQFPKIPIKPGMVPNLGYQGIYPWIMGYQLYLGIYPGIVPNPLAFPILPYGNLYPGFGLPGIVQNPFPSGILPGNNLENPLFNLGVNHNLPGSPISSGMKQNPFGSLSGINQNLLGHPVLNQNLLGHPFFSGWYQNIPKDQLFPGTGQVSQLQSSSGVNPEFSDGRLSPEMNPGRDQRLSTLPLSSEMNQNPLTDPSSSETIQHSFGSQFSPKITQIYSGGIIPGKKPKVFDNQLIPGKKLDDSGSRVIPKNKLIRFISGKKQNLLDQPGKKPNSFGNQLVPGRTPNFLGKHFIPGRTPNSFGKHFIPGKTPGFGGITNSLGNNFTPGKKPDSIGHQIIPGTTPNRLGNESIPEAKPNVSSSHLFPTITPNLTGSQFEQKQAVNKNKTDSQLSPMTTPNKTDSQGNESNVTESKILVEKLNKLLRSKLLVRKKSKPVGNQLFSEQKKKLIENLFVPKKQNSSGSQLFPEKKQKLADTSVSPEMKQNLTDTLVPPEIKQNLADTSVLSEKKQNLADTSVLPEMKQNLAGTSVPPEKNQNLADTSVLPEKKQKLADTSVLLEKTQNSSSNQLFPDQKQNVTSSQFLSSPNISNTVYIHSESLKGDQNYSEPLQNSIGNQSLPGDIHDINQFGLEQKPNEIGKLSGSIENLNLSGPVQNSVRDKTFEDQNNSKKNQNYSLPNTVGYQNSRPTRHAVQDESDYPNTSEIEQNYPDNFETQNRLVPLKNPVVDSSEDPPRLQNYNFVKSGRIRSKFNPSSEDYSSQDENNSDEDLFFLITPSKSGGYQYKPRLGQEQKVKKPNFIEDPEMTNQKTDIFKNPGMETNLVEHPKMTSNFVKDQKMSPDFIGDPKTESDFVENLKVLQALPIFLGALKYPKKVMLPNIIPHPVRSFLDMNNFQNLPNQNFSDTIPIIFQTDNEIRNSDFNDDETESINEDLNALPNGLEDSRSLETSLEDDEVMRKDEPEISTSSEMSSSLMDESKYSDSKEDVKYPTTVKFPRNSQNPLMSQTRLEEIPKNLWELSTGFMDQKPQMIPNVEDPMDKNPEDESGLNDPKLPDIDPLLGGNKTPWGFPEAILQTGSIDKPKRLMKNPIQNFAKQRPKNGYPKTSLDKNLRKLSKLFKIISEVCPSCLQDKNDLEMSKVFDVNNIDQMRKRPRKVIKNKTIDKDDITELISKIKHINSTRLQSGVKVTPREGREGGVSKLGLLPRTVHRFKYKPLSLLFRKSTTSPWTFRSTYLDSSKSKPKLRDRYENDIGNVFDKNGQKDFYGSTKQMKPYKKLENQKNKPGDTITVKSTLANHPGGENYEKTEENLRYNKKKGSTISFSRAPKLADQNIKSGNTVMMVPILGNHLGSQNQQKDEQKHEDKTNEKTKVEAPKLADQPNPATTGPWKFIFEKIPSDDKSSGFFSRTNKVGNVLLESSTPVLENIFRTTTSQINIFRTTPINTSTTEVYKIMTVTDLASDTTSVVKNMSPLESGSTKMTSEVTPEIIDDEILNKDELLYDVTESTIPSRGEVAKDDDWEFEEITKGKNKEMPKDESEGNGVLKDGSTKFDDIPEEEDAGLGDIKKGDDFKTVPNAKNSSEDEIKIENNLEDILKKVDEALSTIIPKMEKENDLQAISKTGDDDKEMKNNEIPKMDKEEDLQVTPKSVDDDTGMTNTEIPKMDKEEDVQMTPKSVDDDIKMTTTEIPNMEKDDNLQVTPKDVDDDTKAISSKLPKMEMSVDDIEDNETLLGDPNILNSTEIPVDLKTNVTNPMERLKKTDRTNVLSQTESGHPEEDITSNFMDTENGSHKIDIDRYLDGMNRDPKDIDRDPEEIVRNPEDMNRNPEDIVRNPEHMERDPEYIVRNSEDMNRNSEDISRDPEDIVRNPEEIIRNSEEIVQNLEDMFRDSEDIVRNPKDIDRDPQDMDRDSKDTNRGPEDTKQSPKYLNQEFNNMDRDPEDTKWGPEDTNQSPEYLNQELNNMDQDTKDTNRVPEYLNRKPEYLDEKPEYLDEEPEYLDQKPEHPVRDSEDMDHETEKIDQKPKDEYSYKEPDDDFRDFHKTDPVISFNFSRPVEFIKRPKDDVPQRMPKGKRNRNGRTSRIPFRTSSDKTECHGMNCKKLTRKLDKIPPQTFYIKLAFPVLYNIH